MKTATGFWLLALLPLCTPMHRSSGGGAGGGGGPFLINPDGSYQFSYDTNTGGFESKQSGSDGAVMGKYGFMGAGGSKVNVQYSAAAGKGDSGSGAAYKEQYTTAHLPQAQGMAGGGQGSYSLSLKPDGTYNYEYSLSDQSKMESRGADGRVKGQFSFTDPMGQNRAISYTADEGGFQATGDHIPGTGSEHSQQSHGGYNSGASSYGASSHGASSYGAASHGASSYGSSNYGAASSYGGSTSGSGGTGTLMMNLGPSGQYDYSYTLSDQAKSEAMGADGKVTGQFSYTGKDGQKKAISYTADERGFLPIGDHIPKPSAEFYEAHQKAAAGASSYGRQTDSYSHEGSNNYGSNSGSHGGSAGTYSFDYQTLGQNHQQSSSGGAVSGQYSVNTDGSSQKVSYSANGKKGYHPTVETSAKIGYGGASSGQMYDSGMRGGYKMAEDSGSGGSWAYQYTAGAHDHQETGSNGQAQGQYNVQSMGGNQQSTYTAGKGGFMPTHQINIKVGANDRKLPMMQGGYGGD